MIDQSHNLKGKIEAMIQTVMHAQELYAKAALVDHERLVAAQRRRVSSRPNQCSATRSQATCVRRSTNGAGRSVCPAIRSTRFTRADTWSGSRRERRGRESARSSYA